MPYASLGGGGKQGCVGGLLSGYGEVAERLWSAPPPALPLLLVFFSLARDEKSREHCREPPPAPPPVRPSPAHAHSLVVLQVELGDVAEEGAVAAAPRQRIDSFPPHAAAVGDVQPDQLAPRQPAGARWDFNPMQSLLAAPQTVAATAE